MQFQLRLRPVTQSKGGPVTPLLSLNKHGFIVQVSKCPLLFMILLSILCYF